MNFYETRMGNIFFNSQMPHLVKALQEIASALRKPVPAIKLDGESMPDPDFLHDLLYEMYDQEIYENKDFNSFFDGNVKQTEAALGAAVELPKELFEQYKAAVSAQSDALIERAFCTGYRAAFQAILSGITMSQATLHGGTPDGQ